MTKTISRYWFHLWRSFGHQARHLHSGASWPRYALAPLCVLILAVPGCKSTPPTPDREPERVEVRTLTADELRDRARRARQPDASRLYMQAARQYWSDEAPSRAAEMLNQLQPQYLSPELRFDYDYLRARLALERLNLEEASEALRQAIPASREQEAERLRLRADVYLARQQPAVAAEALMALSELRTRSDDDDRTDVLQALHDEIWQLMQRLPVEESAHRLRQARNTTVQGWWRLNSAYQQAFDRADLRAAFADWQRNHADHPAIQPAPGALQRLARMEDGPAQITVLLPLSGQLGSAGRAIRDGFLAGYYISGQGPQIRFLDTAGESVTALYEEALATGADLVVGPLDRSNLTSLNRSSFFPVPVLGLNYLAADDSPMPGLFQFSMAIEHEAEAIAQRLIRDEHYRVVLLQAGDDWSHRATRTFSDTFEALGGRVVETDFFASASDVTPRVGTALLVEASEARHAEISQLLGTEVEFLPRRRRDVDALVALVDSSQARALNPALAYHFAGDLPVYTSSQAMQNLSPSQLRELDDMLVSQIPWRVGNSLLREQIEEHLPDSRSGLDSLYAFGLDAYRIADRLPLLTGNGSRLSGATGTLHIDEQGRIQRELVWTQLQQGRLVRLER